MDKIKLFVDDVRSAPEGWTIARTSSEAIQILKKENVVECSLDHDLGGDDTGYKVILFMEENNICPINGISCHSANPVGKARIQAAINAVYSRFPLLTTQNQSGKGIRQLGESITK